MARLRFALLLSATLLSLLSFAAGQTGGNLLTNANFETGDLSGWATPLGANDPGINKNGSLRVISYGIPPYVPYAWAYDGQYSALIESSTLNQSITQRVAVTGGTSYLLSFYIDLTAGDTTFYLRVSAQFNDAANTNVVLLTPNGDSGALQTFCQGSAASQPPFWWSQFKFNVTAPQTATSMNLTFYGYDSQFGILIDSITMVPAAGASFPAAPPATPVVPSTNLLLNGNFETGAAAPWKEAGGDNPYGVLGSVYSGEGAYNRLNYAPHTSVACSEGSWCFVFGAPTAPLPIQQTVAVPSGTTASYTLSFQWYSGGGYNASDPTDLGSSLVVGTVWNSATAATTGSIVFQTYNTTATTAAANFSTVSVSLGSPPSGATSLTIQMQGYAWDAPYTVDYVQLTASGVTAAQSTPVYTCGQKVSALALTGGSNGGGNNNGAAQSFHAGALSTVAALLFAAVLSVVC